MLRKLRLKFVAGCMSLVTLVLLGFFLAAFLSVRQNIAALSQQVLQLVMQEDISSSDYDLGSQVLLPYFTVNVWGNAAYVTGGTYQNLENTEVLEEILTDCLAQGRASGTIETYQLRYLRQDNGLYQRLAFVDTSMERATLRRTMGSYLLICLPALLVLLGISVLLAHWMVRPVEKAWKQQRQFLSDASHELKTPLTVILSNAELLEEAALAERPARWTDNILSEARQMRTLVEEMLTLARADNMVRTATLRECLLSDVAAACALAFEAVAFEAGKTLEEDLEPDVSVLGDGEQLNRLISVLLDNAIKYGEAGGVITMTLRKADKQAVLTVSNSGRPLSAETLSHLFERFYRADDSRGEHAGFGLGLSIARAIAQEHGGGLAAESDAASTRFIFTIPLKK